MKTSKLVGLHVRYQSSIFDVLEKVSNLDMAIAQFFLMKKGDLHHFVNMGTNDKNRLSNIGEVANIIPVLRNLKDNFDYLNIS